jgi:hypothetical protein
MKRARSRWLPLFRGLSLLALGSLWALACGGPQELGGAGSVCFRADDCKDGLACVPTTADPSKSTCSNDLSSIVSMVDGAPAEAAAPVADASGGTAGGSGSAGSAGAGGKPAAGGSSGTAGAGAAGRSSGGAPAGGAPTGGAGKGGSPAAGAGSGTAGSGTAGSGTGGGSGGSEPVDAGDG